MLKPALLIPICLAGLPALAEDGRSARYAFVPVQEGTLRLDTATGAVSLCSAEGTSVACHTVPDANGELRAKLSDLEQRVGALEGELAHVRADAGATAGSPALVRIAAFGDEAGGRLLTAVRRWKASLTDGRSPR